VLRVVSIQLIIIENILFEKSRPYVFVNTGFLLSEAEVRYFVLVIYFVLTGNKQAFENSTWFLRDLCWSKLHKLQFTLTVLSTAWKLESLITHRNYVECIEILRKFKGYKTGFYSLQRNDSANT